jgi:hypothetical protein
LAASVHTLVEEQRKSQECKEQNNEKPDKYQSRLNKEKLNVQIICNLDDNVNRLIDIKHKLGWKTNPGIIKSVKEV